MTAAIAPSPRRANPFAKPDPANVAGASAASFTRSELLPSPRKAPSNEAGLAGVALPSSAERALGSASRSTQQRWRLLWRGGLEIGAEAYRLDGITFAAQLHFGGPSTPTTLPNGFNFTPARPTTSAVAASPFATLPGAETDLCLSLESMKGRKTLRVRDVVHLPAEEELEVSEDAGGVHVYISPQAPLLVSWFTNNLCRLSKLSSSGRSTTAVAIGLGDEGVNNAASSTVLIYGQTKTGESGQQSMTLMAARRKPPPPPQKKTSARPGEPLPRASLFPTNQPKKPPPPFPRRSTSAAPQAAFARARSQSSIYLPPTNLNVLPAAKAAEPPRKKLTPGRRGEKRRKPAEDEQAEVAEKRRRAGKIAPAIEGEGSTAKRPVAGRNGSKEDIFGSKDDGDETGSLVYDAKESLSARSKRIKVSPLETKNKGVIKKQLMRLIEGRGMSRDHEAFKEMFAIVNKGTGFALRHDIASVELDPTDIERIIQQHLDMYWPPAQLASIGPSSELPTADTGATDEPTASAMTAGPPAAPGPDRVDDPPPAVTAAHEGAAREDAADQMDQG